MKACWMVCLVTALSATSAWAESPLQSLQFEQQKQLVLKAVKENVRQQATSAITILPIKCWRPTVTRTRSAKQRWRKSAITKKLPGRNRQNRLSGQIAVISAWRPAFSSQTASAACSSGYGRPSAPAAGAGFSRSPRSLSRRSPRQAGFSPPLPSLRCAECHVPPPG